MGRRGVIALDVGGTKIGCGLFLEDGKLLFQETVLTSQESAAASVAQLGELVEEAVRQAPKDVVTAGVGIVIPGWVNHRARTVWAPNIAEWDHLPLGERLAEKVPIPFFLDSDRSGYVMGESWQGVARGLTDVVFLAVGTGIGAGIISGGRIIHGFDDLAGSVGWLALNPHYGDIYARMGCFEAEASARSVGRKGSTEFAECRGPTGSEQLWTAREVIQAAAAGEPRASKLIDEVVVYLGMGVANLVSTLNPQMVVLGGGLFQSGTYLLEQVRREFARWAQPFAAERVRVELSVLGDLAGLYGAARIALNHV